MINNERVFEAYTGGVGLQEIYCDNNKILNDLGGGVDPSEAADGVYILNSDNGRLYGTEEWTEGKNDNVAGIVLLDGETRTCIALEDVNESTWCEPGVGTIAFYTTSDINEAEKIYRGDDASNQYINKFGLNQYSAVGRCWTYPFKHKFGGYLGSTGEWISIMNRVLEINAFMEYVGRNPIQTTSKYWTSIQYGKNDAWVADLNKGIITMYQVSYLARVRPFSRFKGAIV